jgi:hypothetical protein
MVFAQDGYDAYSHFSEMLNRTGSDWYLSMLELEVYFDDSGTDANSSVAVASCYVSTKDQWDAFNRKLERDA